MKLYTGFTRDYPRPIITEMGGKNPAIVTASADLDEAAEGVMRSAFGFDGQKCSANSRVYVDRSVARDVRRQAGRAARRTSRSAIPTRRDNWMGPVINERALAQVHRRRRGGAARWRHHRGRRRGAARRRAPSAATSRPPRWSPGCRCQPSALPRRAVRAVRGGGRGRLARPGADRGQRHAVRPDGRHLQPRRRRDPPLPGHDPGRRGLRQPPGRARPPAPGRGSRASAAGRAPAHPARAAWARTTSSSSCASSRRR